MAREDAGSIFDMGIDDIDHLGNRRVRTVGELACLMFAVVD
jgi:DNA-directed RNA polymerase beta subunit